MKQSISFPVTEENFTQCWNTVDRLRRKAKRMCLIARTGGFFSNLVLLFCLLFVANGLIYSRVPGTYRQFLDSLPLFSELWAKLTDLLLKPGDSNALALGKLLLAIYGACVVLFAALALLLALLYHPRKQPVPQGPFSARTELLSKAAQEAWSQSFRTKLSPSVLSTVLVVLAAFVLLFAYAIFLQDAAVMMALLSRFPTKGPETNCLIYVLVAYFVCHFFCAVFLLLTRFIYRYQFPYDWMAQAQAAALLTNPEADPRSGEEIRLEALALEREAAYGKAKTMLHNAALLGDIPAMEHFARHCVLSHLNDSAVYWLKRCIASGEATPEARRMLLRLRLRLNHNAHYLRPDSAPLTGRQKVFRILKTVFTVLWRVFVLVLLAAIIIAFVMLLKGELDIEALTAASALSSMVLF